MPDTIHAGKSSQETIARRQARKLGLHNASVDIADVRTYVDEVTKISKEANWEKVAVSTVQGGSILNVVYDSATFDGRYMYFGGLNAITYLRFDTQGQFATVGDWAQMSRSIVQGAVAANLDHIGTLFDGRYVYYSPYTSDTFIRFDTQGTSFTTTADWSQMSMSTAIGAAAVANAYGGVGYDGRYIYFTPHNSDTFIRFDTQGTSFTTTASWEQMSMSTAIGAMVNAAYWGSVFDGRYIYCSAYTSDTFVRFDTQGTSFTTTADWETMAMSTAQGASVLDVAYWGGVFDGRYVYFSPFVSDTFLRFDTKGTDFATVADWSQMSMSTALGAAAVDNAFGGTTVTFDGRYIYYAPFTSATALRFDTQGTSFTTAGDWQQMAVETALGVATVPSAFRATGYDGKYIYYVPQNSDTFLRVLACPKAYNNK